MGIKGLVRVGVLGGAALGLLASPAQADPPPALVTVTCDVWSQQFGNTFPTFAGTVQGTGVDFASAQSEAQTKIWGPYGAMPYLANCR